MFKLVKYLKNYKMESIIGPLFKLLEAFLELLVPLVMAGIIDIGVKNKDMIYTLKMCGLLIGFGILGLVCSLTAQYFAAKAGAGFGTALRKDLFRHINELSYMELDTIGTATLVTRITSDVNQAQAGVNLVLRLFLRAPFIVLGAVVMSFTINARLAWIFVAAVPVLSLIIFGIMGLCIPVYKKVQNQLDGVLRITRESLTGARVIRAFSRQEDEKQDFANESTALMKMQLRVGKISALMNPVTYVVINAAIIIILWSGGKTVYEGIITQGELIALINYMTQILMALLVLAILITSYTKASASAIRINEVFALKSDMKEGTHLVVKKTQSPKVEFKQVSFAYRGGKDALADISFTVNEGETIGIIGGTGSGKSTLVNLIPRFYDVGQGKVLVDGADVKEYPYGQLRGKIGMVPQNAVLFTGTVRDNMKWGKADAADEEINRALDIAQASTFVEEKEKGLNTRILQGGRNLSGGQKQRLTIARALVGRPEILILDDSASALDFATDAKLRQALMAQTEKMTVFIVSQRAASIRQADRILVLDDGKLVGNGTHEELLDNCEVYNEICMSQLSKKELGRA